MIKKEKKAELISIDFKKNVGVIGHFGGNENFLDGQTIKTKEINSYLEKKYSIVTNKFDTYKNSRNPFKLFKGVKNIVKQSDLIIFLLSSRGYKVILPLLIILNFSENKKIIEFVIGGNRHEELKKDTILRFMAKKVDKIYVETDDMKKEYEKLGFTNTEVINNFKNLEKAQEKKYNNKKNLYLCTFSRVCKEKGIEIAIDAVNKCNNILKNEGKIVLDIYGQVDDSYNERFIRIQQKFNENIHYKGAINYNESVQVLSKYDLLLFLTYWKSEGFPGTIIDSFFAGLPVLATDWNYNFKILSENDTGIKVNPQNTDDVVEKILLLYRNQDILYLMHKKCLNEAKKYSPDKIMSKANKYIESVIGTLNE